MMEKKYFTLTYGCQMNESDTERINGQLEELGYTPAETMEEADIIIMNTCSIRQNAEEKVYGKIGEIKKLKDKIRICFWGSPAVWHRRIRASSSSVCRSLISSSGRTISMT